MFVSRRTERDRLTCPTQLRSSYRRVGKKKNPCWFPNRGFSVKSLAVTYSGMPERHTTIGAERFHFRVRNGIGWFPLAIATRQTVSAYGPYLRTARLPESGKFLVSSALVAFTKQVNCSTSHHSSLETA